MGRTSAHDGTPTRAIHGANRIPCMVVLVAILPTTSSCHLEPDPCEETCDQAQRLFEACLDDWGIDWTDAGYQDADDYLDACLTWAWEMRTLAADAGDPGAADSLCEERTTELETGTCDAYLAIDWAYQPWQ